MSLFVVVIPCYTDTSLFIQSVLHSVPPEIYTNDTMQFFSAGLQYKEQWRMILVVYPLFSTQSRASEEGHSNKYRLSTTTRAWPADHPTTRPSHVNQWLRQETRRYWL